MLLSGGKIIVEALKKEGVEIIFGYPGGVALPLYDALYDAGIRHILTRHEQGAAHAADGYARASGKVGVCLATSGPGATNLITGIATANMDSVPLVFITSQVTSANLGKDSFQEADVTGITTPITKHNYMVSNTEELPRIMAEAFYIARSGRPGPVVVDIPKDIFLSKAEFKYPEKIEMKGYKPLLEGDATQIEAVAAALTESKKPLLFLGGGAVNAGVSKEVLAFVEKTGIPFVNSLMGLSLIDTRHPMNLGMVGMHGTAAANLAMTNCDLLIGLGVRFDDRVTGRVSKFAPYAKIAHFEVDPSEINKIIKVDYKVLGDLSWSMPILLNFAKACDIGAWHEEINKWQQEMPLVYKDDTDELKPQAVIEAVNKIMADNSIVVTDVGQHQMWAAQYSQIRHPRGFLTSGGLGTMGYGLPAAIGAALACPDEEVWLFVGDGGIMMNCQEMATAVEEELPIKVVVLNNSGLGMVRQWQRLFYGYRYSFSRHNVPTDIAKLAEAFGAKGLTVTNKDDLPAALMEVKSAKGPVFINVMVHNEENVYPMVAPDGTLDQMMW